MICSRSTYLILSIIGLVITLPLALVALYYISTLDTNDLFSPSEKFQISEWGKWCDKDISQFTSVVEITEFLEDKKFHQIIRPAYTRSIRKFYEIYQYEGYQGYGGKMSYINEYRNEQHVYLTITDRNVRNWHMGSLLDKTLQVTIGYKEGKIIQCRSVVNRHGR